MRQGIPVPRRPAFPEKPKGESSIADSGEVHHRMRAMRQDRAAIRLYLTPGRSIRIVICTVDIISSTFRVSSALRETWPVLARARGV
jgi:hypothetical protein